MTFKTVLLGDVAAKLTVGHVGSMANEYLPDGIPFLRSLNILPYRISTNEIRYVSEAFHKKLNKSALTPGDIVIVRTGKPGTCSVIPDWLPISNCSDLVIVRCGTNIRPKYLAYWVNSLASHHIGSSLVGAVQQHFNVGSARKMPILLPDLSEQDNILEILASLDDKIELNRQMNEVLEGMARAVFRDWFVDFGPTRRKMAGEVDPVKILGGAIATPAQAQKTATLFPDRLGENGLPEGWERVPVGEISDIAGGGTPKTKTEEFWLDGKHFWATPRDLSKLSGVYIRETERKLTNAGLAKVSSGLAPIGSVLMSSRAPIGYLAISGVPVAVNQGFIVMRPTKRFPTHFAKLWCEENMETIEANANGSTFQEISKKNFKPILVTSPSVEVLGAFSEIVGALYKLISNNEVENQTLAEMRDLLLPKLMSGEIQLREGA